MQINETGLGEFQHIVGAVPTMTLRMTRHRLDKSCGIAIEFDSSVKPKNSWATIKSVQNGLMLDVAGTVTLKGGWHCPGRRPEWLCPPAMVIQAQRRQPASVAFHQGR